MKRINFCVLGLFLLPALTLDAKIKVKVDAKKTVISGNKGYLGVYSSNLSKAKREAMGVDHGVLITGVAEDSPAEEAGLKSGDIILAFDGDTIEGKDEFTELIEANPGKLVELTVLREGRELKLQAKLGEKEKKEESGVSLDFGENPPWKGGIARMAMLIPIIAIVMTFLVPIMWFYFDYRKRALRSKERMLAIEKGVELPPEPVRIRKVGTPLDTLRKGFICLGVGVALVVFNIVSPEKRTSVVFMGGGLILLFIGLALVLWYRVAIKKEKDSSTS